jgi:DNA-binding transcriptional LysR family regulator
LHVTQSAISKQVIALEASLGVPLFERKTRALALTSAGDRLQRATDSAFAELRSAVTYLASAGEPTVNLATTPAFAAFWLIPRLADFRRGNPGIDIRISVDMRVVDLDRGGFDAAIRYLSDKEAPANALRLVDETVLPVCSPALLKQHPLKNPEDLAGHILLSYEDEKQRRPWQSWPVWLEMAGVPNLRPAGTVQFNLYEPAIRAAVEDQGVALATLGLVSDLLKSGALVAPLPHRYSKARAYYFIVGSRAAENPAITPFRTWLAAQGAAADQTALSKTRA